MDQLDIFSFLSLTFYIVCFFIIIYFFQLFEKAKKGQNMEKIEVTPLKKQESKITGKFSILKNFIIEKQKTFSIKKHKFFVKYFYIFLYKNQDRIRIIYEVLIYCWLITLIISLLYLLIFNYRIKDNIYVFYCLFLLTFLKMFLKTILSQLDWCLINDYKYFNTVLLVLPFYSEDSLNLHRTHPLRMKIYHIKHQKVKGFGPRKIKKKR